MGDHPKITWRAAIKRATMTQKFNDKGEVHSTLQLQCEGDMLAPENTGTLARLQKESIVTITIEAAQLAFDWVEPAPEGGNSHAQISDEGRGGGGDPAEELGDDLGGLP
jgi:hypothetical protein